ncbi:MAG TPA: MbnP family protein [Bacteroidia bacterium]|nr:MbnP family protein [Bacteroidia bacterium]
MVRAKNILISCAICLIGFIIFSFRANTKGKVIIEFKNYAGSSILQLDSTYQNALGQDFVIANFKYYVGNICLKEISGKNYIAKDYFLVSEHEDESKQIILNDVPEGNYTAIEFIIGVDSLHNCSGLQQGALDPTKGMFWAWNTGYVFLKLDGHATASKSEGHIFEYHIGGYKQPTNSIRKITLNFKGNKTVSSTNPLSILIKANALEVLKTPTTIDFSKLPSVTDTRNAYIIANNYMDMFSLLN